MGVELCGAFDVWFSTNESIHIVMVLQYKAAFQGMLTTHCAVSCDLEMMYLFGLLTMVF